MSISYNKLSKHTKTFLRVAGVNLHQFQVIVEEVRPLWLKLESGKKCVGRTSNLSTLEDKILCLLVYYRCYITHILLGIMFNLDASNVCRLFKKLEPLLAKKIHIKKDRTLTYEKLLEIISDVTESPTQRPQKNKEQKKKYSGKKKKHTNKTEIVMEKESGKIINVSKSYGGRTHDFKIRKNEKLLPKNTKKLVDSGYQGLQKLQSNVFLPFKRSKRGVSLTKEQKQHNNLLSSNRIKVENKIREVKIFRIIKDTYRNFQKKYNMRFNIIAGIVNLKNGYSFA